MPYPPFRGDKLKIYNLAKELAHNHELHVLTIAENKEDINSVAHLLEPINDKTDKVLFTSVRWVFRPKWISALSAIWGLFSNRPLQVAFFRSRKFQVELNRVLATNTFDAIHIQHLRMAQYFENSIPQNAILDLPDAFSLYWKRRYERATNGIERFFRRLEYQRLAAYEQLILPQFKRVLVCSQEDQQYLKGNGINNVELLPNGVNLKTFSPISGSKIIPNRILFTGNMDYAPNVDAVQYFVSDIFPIILKDVPAARFIIAGQRPVKAVLDLQSENIEVTGFVKDLAEEYAIANVVVSPLRIGAGTQNKVLEALAMDKAVVCTHVGFKGLGINSGEGIMMASKPDLFAQYVIDILRDSSLAHRLGESGGNHVRTAFSWTAISNRLISHFNSIFYEKNI